MPLRCILSSTSISTDEFKVPLKTENVSFAGFMIVLLFDRLTGWTHNIYARWIRYGEQSEGTVYFTSTVFLEVVLLNVASFTRRFLFCFRSIIFMGRIEATIITQYWVTHNVKFPIPVPDKIAEAGFIMIMCIWKQLFIIRSPRMLPKKTLIYEVTGNCETFSKTLTWIQ